MTNSSLPRISHEKARIIIGGFINLNVIDGSAFFIAGLAAMCAENPFLEILVVSPTVIEKTEVIAELAVFPNVTVVDPIRAHRFAQPSREGTESSLSRKTYAEFLADITETFRPDCVIIRDTETASHFVDLEMAHRPVLATYVTGLTSLGGEASPELKGQLRNLAESGSKFLCQTLPIAEALAAAVQLPDSSSLFVLPPHVPSSNSSLDELRANVQDLRTFVYTGKFFDAWNTDKIFAAFKALNSQGAGLRIDVAGDQFRHSIDDPFFVANTRYLLDSTPGLTWHGRLPRSESRSLIAGSSTGIGWRSNALANSSEFSTKILEYGALGRPTITNPTYVNLQVLGREYPLYADSTSEFKSALLKSSTDHGLVDEAAEICFSVSSDHTYDNVRPKLLNFLMPAPFPQAGSQAPTSNFSIPLSSLHEASVKYPALGEVKVKASVFGDSALFTRVADGGTPFSAAVASIVNYMEVWKEFRNSPREFFLFDATSVGAQPTIREGRAGEELLSTKQKLELREKELAASEVKLKAAQQRLTSLQSSTLGALQVEIWKQRKQGATSFDLAKILGAKVGDYALRPVNKLRGK